MLKKLYLHHFRNYEEKRFDFSSSKVLLCGPNGIGKTNILEAIYYLSVLRSFKNTSVRELIQNEKECFNIMALADDGRNEAKIHIEQWKNGNRSCSVNGIAEKKTSALINNFRTVVFAPEDRMIISGTAALRRRFFDILISLEDNSYLHDLQQFKHALAQRNAILKKGELTSKSSVFMPFEELMAFHGAKIMAQRNIFAEKISKEVNLLANDDKFHIQYRPHWKSDDLNSICQSLARSRHRDFQKGFTTEGIQLDDFEMILNGFAMRNFASSGQIRIHSLYLKMAEFNLSLAGGRKLIALIDDVTGELDKENEEKFFTLLDNAEQSFFTFTAPRQISLSQQLISLP